MASKSSFTDFCDPLIEAIAVDWFANEPRYQDIFVPSQSLQISPCSPSESFSTLFLETPPDQPFTSGVLQDILYSLHIPHETSISQPRTAATPPYNALFTASHDEVTGAGLGFTGFTKLFNGVLPIPSLPTPSLPTVTAFPHDWIKVPQRVYDYGSRRWDFKRSEPISFSTNSCPGINLGDALRKEFTGLDGRDDQMLQGFAGAISCRLLFPGYPDNGKLCQIHALNWTRNRRPITRGKLTHEVARQLDRYLNRMARVTPDNSIEICWRIGQGFMHIDNMFLVNLVSVSKGSFQPEIWVADPSVPYIRAGWDWD